MIRRGSTVGVGLIEGRQGTLLETDTGQAVTYVAVDSTPSPSRRLMVVIDCFIFF